MPDNDGETVACASLAVTPTPPIVTDNCGGTIIPTGPSIGGTYVGCEGTRTYTYHYADCEGNNHDWVYTYTIQREEFVLPANTGSSVACIDLATVPTPPVIGDNCGGTITPTGPSIGGTYNGCEGTRTYTYHYADCSEISKDWVYTYVIEREDFTMPSNTGSTVACEALAVTPTAPTVTDNCGGTITPTGPTIGGTYTNCEGTKTYTYHYADCEGNNHDWVYTYIIEREDFTIPSNTGSYVACIASATTPIPPVVEDNCGRIIIPTGPTSGGTYDGCEGTRTYTYHYADCEGNNHDWVYTYIIEREDFTMPLNTGRTVACASLAVAPTLPVVTDNCGGTIIPTGPIVGGTYITCEGTITYTYHYADCEGNNHDWVYTYTIEREDFTMPSNTGTTVACATSAVAPTPPVVTDNCGGTIIPTGPVVGGTYTTCEGTKTYTYHYQDCEGNNHDWVYTYIIDITTPPHFTYVPGNLTIQCPATPVFGTPTAISSCGTAVNITYLDNTLPGTCPQEYSATRTWTATDCAGNTATASQTISVEDNTPPTWTTLPGALDASLDCGDETGITNALNLVPEATDNCGNVTVTEIPEENCFGNDQAGSINAGQGNYFPFTINGFNNLTANDIASISLHFTTNQGKGRAEFTLVNPSGQGIILVGPYCSDDVDCNDPDPSNQEFYTPTFYPDASGYPQWVNSNTIPQGLGNFTPWGATTSPNAGTINGLTSYVSSFEEFTGPMNGTWFVFARKQATVNGSIDFNSICMTPGACGNDNLTIKSWIATDDCGNTSAPFTQIISITDTEAPVITLPVTNLALECYDAEAVNAWINTAVAIDECQGSVAVQSSFDVPADNCDETVVVTFTATDNCGNIATSTKSFTVDDNTAPEITLPAANLSMDCFDVAEVNAWLATAGAVDNCNGTVNITPSYIVPAGDCDELVTVTFTATDECNNVATATKTFIVDDNTAPQFSEIPLEKTIECPATPIFDTPIVTDNCDETPLVSSIDETIQGDCSQEYSITRTWTATDDCNNSAIIEQTIHVIDNTPPAITVPPTDLVLECFDINAINAWLSTASVTDECDASVTLMNSYDTPESFCDAPILVTFTATDDCGNIGTATKSFLVDDHTAPEITVPESNLSLSCYDAAAVNEWAATAYAIDNCGGDIDVVTTYIAPLGNCNEEIVVTFTATDGCGNEASATKSFIVDDDLVPVLHNVPSNTTVSCDAIPAPADVTATDNCDTDVIVVYDQIKTDGPCANSYTLTRTWTATDDCNNSASCTQVITVQDTEPPAITVPAASLTMSCFDATLVNEWAATAFATDNCDEYVEVIPTYTAPLGNCEETVLVTFTATDDCGNIGTASKTFTVDDNIAPEVYAPEYSLTMTCYDASQVAEWIAQATAYDNCSGSLAVSSDFTAPIDNCNETVTVTFTATDDCGNVGISTQTFIVNDNEAPVIVAPSPLEIVCDQANDPTTIINNWLASSYATDNCDSDIQVTNNFEGVNQSCNETTTITFYASDNCGNQAINATSTIIIIDNIPPVITNLPGSLDLSVECSDPEALSDALALVPTATDNCTLTPEIHLISETNYEGECVGEYQIVRIWNFTDDCENTSAEFVQTISIIDNTPPSWINPPVDLTVECDAQSNPQSLYTWLSSFYGEDNCSSATPGNNFNGLSDLCGATGSATVTFTLTDDCGNITSTTATYSIVDTQTPVFTYVPEPITVECDGSFEIGTPEAIDGCSSVTITYVGEVRTDGNCPNSYTLLRTWSAADECNNTSTCTQLITVQDNTPPVFTYVPENITVECDEIPEPGIATATDNCDPEVLPVYIGQIRTDGNCDNSYTLTRTWNATDDCNNTATATQIITVIDVTPPVFTTIPENLTVECDGLGNATQLENWLNSAVASDNCGTASVTNNYTGLSNECGNTGSATVIFTATDECGLTSTTSATFTIVDTTDPLINEPADITVDNDPGLCGAQVNLAIATASDGCGSATVTNNITGTNNASGYYPVGTTTIIWTAIDECGNTSTDQTVVTVEDTEDPLITCPDDITVDADLGVCNAYVNVPQPEVSDNCEIRQITNTYTHTDDASAEYPVGVTQVWWTVVDWSGNTANCMMTITVNDVEDPTIECPEDIAVNTDPGACGAYVEVPEPVANDNCSINSVVNSFNGTPNATGDYPVGVTVVTWTVTDMSGNTATCSMTVTVTDNELPTIECPQDITVNNDPGICGANIEIPVPVVDDNCGIESIVNDFNGTGNASGEYPIGTTTIVWTVTDIHGNTATCTTVVTVTDTEAPTIECPTNVEVSTDPGICGAFVTIPEPTVDDNCEINSISNDFNNTNNATGDYPVGTTTITWTVTDIHGNTTTCIMTVTVTDTEAPVVICPPDIEVTGDLTCTAQVEVPEPEVSDNCSVASYINNINFTGNASGTYPVGTTLITWTVTDINGNITNCTTTVTVTAPPFAVDDITSTDFDTPVTIMVLENDTDCNDDIIPSSVTNTTNPSNGTVLTDPSNGSFIYTPNAGFEGTDTFYYKVCDEEGLCDTALVTITVNTSTLVKLIAVDDADTTEVNTSLTINNLVNDTYQPFVPVVTILAQPKHGTIMMTGNTVTYKPDTDYTGTDEYTYILSNLTGVAIPDTAVSTILIVPAPARDTLIIYNVITPDNDGHNDTWWIEGIEEYPDNEVLIFNRWGDQVRYFEHYNNTSVVWNGTNKSGTDLLPAGTYYYIVKLRSLGKVYTGWVIIHGHQ
jgi:gliding motility-associated-like protein